MSERIIGAPPEEKEDPPVCAGELARLLMETLRESFGKDNGTALELALRHGWAQPEDVREADKPLSRSAAARIVHEFLKRELGERDEEDVRAAGVLRDLYDCRTCVNHVAQVYCKGILPAVREGVFGMREKVTRREAAGIAERANDRRKRQSGAGDHAWPQAGPVQLSGAEAAGLVRDCPDCRFIDVRTAWEYANGHPQGAEHIPLMRIMEHPETVGDDKAKAVLLGCDGGYRSEMAAVRLWEAGYSKVYFYGWEEDT